MINDARAVLDRLNSPSDWALVLGAGTLGLVLDGAINVVPLPFFSPGICALTAASAMLSVKRGLEAAWSEKAKRRKTSILQREASRCAERLRERGDELAADEFEFDVMLAANDDQALELLVRDARYQRRHLEGYAFRGALATARFYGGGEVAER
jgi:hypothetical protein